MQLGISSLNARNALKLILLGQRTIYTVLNGSHVVCPICQMPIKGMQNVDMHEALITKGMVANSPFADRINHSCNCVLRHHVCPGGKKYHDAGIGSEETYFACAKNITEFVGEENVVNWLMSMKEYFPNVAQEALNRYVGSR